MNAANFITDKRVADRYGVDKSTIWRWVEKGRFPKPVKLSPGCTRWNLATIEAWEAEKEAAA